METKVIYDSDICRKRFHDNVESITSLPISMVHSSDQHGFKLPADFKPVSLGNVKLISPQDQLLEGELKFRNKVENKIIVNTLTAGMLYSMGSADMES